jgi:hypothetical protein
LPEHFVPSRLLVTLNSKGQGKPPSRSFDWNTLTAPDSKPNPETSGTGALEQQAVEATGDDGEND